MIICMFNKNHSCCSGELIKTVTLTLSSMHLPRRSHPRACFFMINVLASLVTTSHFFYLLNINNQLKITCGKYGRQTACHSHSVSIIKRADACDCVIQSVEIQLIGSHSNCNYNGNFNKFKTLSILSLNGSIIKLLCLIIGKTNISYIYLVKPAYPTSPSSNPISRMCLLLTQCHLSQ